MLDRLTASTLLESVIEAYVEEFERQVREMLSRLGDPSNAMRTSSDGMPTVCGQTNASEQIAAKASDHASMSMAQ